MRASRPWIEIVVAGVTIACALAVALATLGAAAGPTEDYAEPSSSQAATVPAIAASVSAASSSQSFTLRYPASQTQVAESASVQDASERTYEGVVTCSRCGARHPADSGETAATCSRACVRTGAGFTLVDGETLYLLEGNNEMIKPYAGQRAQVAGLMAGNTIRVASVSAVK